MSGSGGGNLFGDGRSPRDIQDAIRREEEISKKQAFDTEINETIGKLLTQGNWTHPEAVSKALDDIRKAIEDQLENSVNLIFGGSVRKHTYVDGISDVDSLVILRDPKLRSTKPSEVLQHLEEILRKALPDWTVQPHRPLAITLIKESLQIQIVPAIKEEKRLAIPSAKADRWSRINPEYFFRELTKANERAGSKLIPTIKLVKNINDDFPKTTRLSGYHIEALAIEAFRGYLGPKNPKEMIEHFFERARELVLKPIKDTTGQSIHVDDDLGPAESAPRKEISANLDRIFRKMKNADGMPSKEQWLSILGE